MIDLTIIIPTYNESDNVGIIVEKIRKNVSEGCLYEILFVDDSVDQTPEVLNQICCEFSEVRYIHRNTEKGLASAVVKGLQCANGKYIIVMDADLQHPPELIPLIVKRLANADIVIPSRFIEGGSDGGLNPFRKLISWTARSLGRLLIRRLRYISDCTSGYFGINYTAVQGVKLEPIGWKILMEILVRGKYHTVHEIPYSFAARDLGESKMNWQEQLNYLKHIARLVCSSPEDRRLYFFCIVGMMGVFVNLLTFLLLVSLLRMNELDASIGASLIALSHNFIWNDTITWKGHGQRTWWRRLLQFPQFLVISSLGIITTTLFSQTFLMLEWNIFAGQFIGILISTSWNFFANNKWTWQGRTGSTAMQEERIELIVTQEY